MGGEGAQCPNLPLASLRAALENACSVVSPASSVPRAWENPIQGYICPSSHSTNRSSQLAAGWAVLQGVSGLPAQPSASGEGRAGGGTTCQRPACPWLPHTRATRWGIRALGLAEMGHREMQAAIRVEDTQGSLLKVGGSCPLTLGRWAVLGGAEGRRLAGAGVRQAQEGRGHSAKLAKNRHRFRHRMNQTGREYKGQTEPAAERWDGDQKCKEQSRMSHIKGAPPTASGLIRPDSHHGSHAESDTLRFCCAGNTHQSSPSSGLQCPGLCSSGMVHSSLEPGWLHPELGPLCPSQPSSDILPVAGHLASLLMWDHAVLVPGLP